MRLLLQVFLVELKSQHCVRSTFHNHFLSTGRYLAIHLSLVNHFSVTLMSGWDQLGVCQGIFWIRSAPACDQFRFNPMSMAPARNAKHCFSSERPQGRLFSYIPLAQTYSVSSAVQFQPFSDMSWRPEFPWDRVTHARTRSVQLSDISSA